MFLRESVMSESDDLSSDELPFQNADEDRKEEDHLETAMEEIQEQKSIEDEIEKNRNLERKEQIEKKQRKRRGAAPDHRLSLSPFRSSSSPSVADSSLLINKLQSPSIIAEELYSSSASMGPKWHTSAPHRSATTRLGRNANREDDAAFASLHKGQREKRKKRDNVPQRHEPQWSQGGEVRGIEKEISAAADEVKRDREEHEWSASQTLSYTSYGTHRPLRQRPRTDRQASAKGEVASEEEHEEVEGAIDTEAHPQMGHSKGSPTFAQSPLRKEIVGSGKGPPTEPWAKLRARQETSQRDLPLGREDDGRSLQHWKKACEELSGRVRKLEKYERKYKYLSHKLHQVDALVDKNIFERDVLLDSTTAKLTQLEIENTTLRHKLFARLKREKERRPRQKDEEGHREDSHKNDFLPATAPFPTGSPIQKDRAAERRAIERKTVETQTDAFESVFEEFLAPFREAKRELEDKVLRLQKCKEEAESQRAAEAQGAKEIAHEAEGEESDLSAHHSKLLAIQQDEVRHLREALAAKDELIEKLSVQKERREEKLKEITLLLTAKDDALRQSEDEKAGAQDAMNDLLARNANKNEEIAKQKEEIQTKDRLLSERTAFLKLVEKELDDFEKSKAGATEQIQVLTSRVTHLESELLEKRICLDTVELLLADSPDLLHQYHALTADRLSIEMGRTFSERTSSLSSPYASSGGEATTRNTERHSKLDEEYQGQPDEKADHQLALQRTLEEHQRSSRQRLMQKLAASNVALVKKESELKSVRMQLHSTEERCEIADREVKRLRYELQDTHKVVETLQAKLNNSRKRSKEEILARQAVLELRQKLQAQRADIEQEIWNHIHSSSPSHDHSTSSAQAKPKSKSKGKDRSANTEGGIIR